jgi:hypothetical protein
MFALIAHTFALKPGPIETEIFVAKTFPLQLG